VLGVEKGLALIEQTEQTEAILITAAPQFNFIKTAGVDKSIE